MKKVLLTGIVAILFVSNLSSEQIIKTQLALTVRNDLGNTVEGARVKLYESEEDYQKEENLVAEGTTDNKGVARFKELKAISYFILVEKDDLNNFGGGERIEALQSGRINKATIVIQ